MTWLKMALDFASYTKHSDVVSVGIVSKSTKIPSGITFRNLSLAPTLIIGQRSRSADSM